MALREINFDGIVGPSHNYAGLSLGNLASTRNAGQSSPARAPRRCRASTRCAPTSRSGSPRACSCRTRARTAPGWPSSAPTLEQAEPALARQRHVGLGDVGGQCRDRLARARTPPTAAATSPSPTCKTMPHRSHEWPATLAQLRLAFADEARFAVHGPVPPAFGDEGAANHMRLAPPTASRASRCSSTACRGGAFPARQHIEASKAIARLHGLDPDRTLFVEQSEEAIAAGAFHNDVVAVANERVLFAHEKAFADRGRVYRRAASGWSRASRSSRCRMPRCRLADAISLLSVQRPAGHACPSGEHGADRAERSARDAVGVELARTASRRQRPDPARLKWSTSASRWPMAAARPACACASSPTRRRSIRASWSTRPSSMPWRKSSRRHWPAEISADDIKQPALVAQNRAGASRFDTGARTSPN